MAFNLRRIRCLATQTTAIGFHLMNRARAFGSIFALGARLKLDLPLAPPPTAAALLIFYLLPATYASMILLNAGEKRSPLHLCTLLRRCVAEPFHRVIDSCRRLSRKARIVRRRGGSTRDDTGQVNFQGETFSPVAIGHRSTEPLVKNIKA